MAMPDYWVGYDLGKMGDHTARSVLLRTYDGSVTEFGFYGFDLACVLIERIPLGTPYLAIARDAGQFVYRHPEFAGNPTRSIYLAIDATGVGTGVVEMFDSVFGGRSQSRIRIVPIMITCGLGAPLRERGTWHVPKQELVMKTYAALATRQLRIHPKLEHAKLLKHELANYQTKTTESGRNIFAAREGEHDDLIMALCLPTLAASLPFYQLIPSPEEEKAAEVRWQGKIRREMEAMRQEEEAEKTPEQLALEREQSRLEAARQAEEADDVRFGFGWGDDSPRASWS